MSSARPALRPLSASLVAIAAVALLALGGRGCARATIAARVRHAAAARGLTASWRAFDLTWPLRVRFTGLALVHAAGGDTVFSAESFAVTLDPLHALLLHPEPSEVVLAHARLVRPAPATADTLAPEEEARHPRARPDRSARVRHIADGAVQALLLPARRLPRLSLLDLTFTSAPAADEAASDVPRAALHIAALELRRRAGGVTLEAAGTAALEQTTPFDLALSWDDDDRLDGSARIGIADPRDGHMMPLRLAIDGRLRQDHARGVVRTTDSTRVLIGDLAVFVSGEVARQGPAVHVRLACDGLSEQRLFASVPRPLLGPLVDLAVAGTFDYRLGFDLDLARPDSVDFNADVIPHGLMLDPSRTRLDIVRLDRPFVATIHLPHDVRVTRELSDANPHFLPLARIDSTLVHAVVANEDGGFYRHRGFNIEAVKLAIADDIHAAAYRRGAGTITMQLARNLWLGHERTLARKAQEVVLAWVLEHLTGLGKERLLEIYLNIIEWGPGVHGADEATRYYFGHGAERVTVDEALFLTTVVPAPIKWRSRLEKDGTLRAFERAQMHFIGRAMAARGWLDPEALPPTDSLRVELRGPARDVLFPPDTSTARADSTVMASEAVPPR